jgi:hypothetical protein
METSDFDSSEVERAFWKTRENIAMVSEKLLTCKYG